MRNFHIVFSSSWTRREQAENIDEWQIMAPKTRQIAVNTVGATAKYKVLYKEKKR